MSDRIDIIADKFAEISHPDSTLKAYERVYRATDNQGNVIIKGRTAIELTSPDGTVWRVRVDNSGNLYTAEAPPTS